MKMTGALVRDSLKWWLVVVHFSSYSLLIHLVYLQSLDTFPVYSLFSLCLCIYLITMPKISPRPEHIINIEYIKWSVGYFLGRFWSLRRVASVVVHLANESPPVIMSRVCVIMNDDKGAELTGCSWGWLYGKRDNHHVVLPISSRFGSGPRPRSFCRRRTDRERPGIPSITLPEYNREIKIHLNRLRGNYWLSGFAGHHPSNEWPGEQSRAEHCGVNWLTWWT